MRFSPLQNRRIRRAQDLASLGNVRPPSRWRRRVVIGAIYLLVVAICTYYDPKQGAHGVGTWFESSELSSYKWRMQEMANRYASIAEWARKQIVLVQLTDATFDKNETDITGPPAPRNCQAKVVRELTRAGVKGIVYDMMFDSETEKKKDDDFAAALRESNRTYIGCWLNEDNTALEKPIPKFCKVARLAHILSPQTPDQVVIDRMVPVIHTPDGQYIPSLSLAGALQLAGMGKTPIKPAPGGWQIGNFYLPVNEDGTFNIKFWDKPTDDTTAGQEVFTRMPYEFVYEGIADDEFIKKNKFFKDKIALVGDVTKLGNDFRLTVRGQMSGMEIQAHAMATLMAAQHMGFPLLREAPQWVNYLTIVIMAALACWFAAALRPLIAIAAACTTMLFYILLNRWLFTDYALYIHLIPPSSAILLTTFGIVAERNFSEERQKTWMRGLLQRYVSPQVADYLVAHPEKLQLGGEMVTATVLFSDIRGFTAISQHFEVQHTVGLLNEYLQAMTDVIFAYNGTLDKYMGDGIMVVFGAPEQYEDHARRAVSVAIDMQAAMQPLRAGWKERGLPLLDIGVGVATGPMIAGNMGASQRREFTVVGDTVNLASRIEGLNKDLHTKLLIHESTYIVVKDEIEARGPLAARVKGHDEDVIVYEVFGWKDKTAK